MHTPNPEVLEPGRRLALKRTGWALALAVASLAALCPLLGCAPAVYRVGYYHGVYRPAPYHDGGYYYRAPRYQAPPSRPYRGVRPYHPGRVIVAPDRGRGPVIVAPPPRGGGVIVAPPPGSGTVIVAPGHGHPH